MLKLIKNRLREFPNNLGFLILSKKFNVEFWINFVEILNLANLSKKDLYQFFKIKNQFIFWYLTVSIFKNGRFGNKFIKQQIYFTVEFKIFENYRNLLSNNELLNLLNQLLYKEYSTLINNKSIVTIIKLSIDLNETKLIQNEFEKQISKNSFSIFDIWSTAVKSADIFHQEGLFAEAELLLLKAKEACDLAGERPPGNYNENSYLTAVGHLSLLGILIMGKKSGFLARSRTSLIYCKEQTHNRLFAEILISKAKEQNIEISECLENNLIEPDMELFHKSILNSKPEYVIARKEYGNLFKHYNYNYKTPFLDKNDLTPNMINTAKKILLDNGVLDMNNLIGIHCRENQSISRANRNSDFTKLIKPINFMTKSGKSVVRLGSFNSNNKTDSGINFVDLTTLKLKQYEYESVNLFIWANSKLFLGNLSGGTFPPMLFGVPILWFDIFPYRHFVPPGINDKVLPKKLFSIKEGRMLSLNELFSPKYANLQTESPVSLSRKGFKLIDTTESEILDCLNEIYGEKQLILTSVERLSAVKQSTLNFDSGMDLYSKLPKTFLINNEQYSE